MMCLKHIMLFSLLLPMPAASPMFLCLFAAAVFFAIRPCGYCLVLFATLFLSTSPNSPFLTPSPSPLPLSALNSTTNSSLVASTSDSDHSPLPLDAPVPSRTWLSTNAGRIFDPSLVGYREIARNGHLQGITALARNDHDRSTQIQTPMHEGEEEAEPSASSSGASAGSAEPSVAQPQSQRQRIGDQHLRQLPTYLLQSVRDALVPPIPNLFSISGLSRSSPSPSKPKSSRSRARAETETSRKGERALPPGYVDLSWKGVGFIVDFGWKRSAEGMEWEVARELGEGWRERMDAAAAAAAAAAEAESKLEGRKVPEHPNGLSEMGGSVSQRDPEGTTEKDKDKEMDKENRGLWSRIPLVGSW